MGDAQATVTDRATGATIDARLYAAAEWQTVLFSCFDVSRALEEGNELFLVAAKR
jgi:hypothetical protein